MLDLLDEFAGRLVSDVVLDTVQQEDAGIISCCEMYLVLSVSLMYNVMLQRSR